VIKFGATVTLIDEDTDEKSAYQIVGEDEADIKSKRLAITAPSRAHWSARRSAIRSR
jgi:transcription elongation factor GreA